MRRHLRIENLLLATATFCLGVIVVPDRLVPDEAERNTTRRDRAVNCIPFSGPERTFGFRGSERIRRLDRQIVETEFDLLRIRREGGLGRSGDRFGATRGRLEEKLRLLMDERDRLLREKGRDLGSEPDGWKLVYRQICYEN